MIAVDASVLVAILAHEPEREAYITFLAANPATVSPVGYWEAAIAARRVLETNGVTELDSLIAMFGIVIAPATAATAKAAVDAAVRFGKHTSAKLNMGDCFAYALATELNAPLLFKGDDFPQTDIRPALPTGQQTP